MKAHFDTPGAAPTESLNNLTAGMNCKAAAMLFYHTCGIFSSQISSIFLYSAVLDIIRKSRVIGLTDKVKSLRK